MLYFYRAEDMPLFLLTAFAKNEKSNISKSEQASLIEICDLIARSYGSRR